uniref:CRIB domain-containing protein n=1 Tax=Schistosoma curassoni TaxID=6186 RepID=A0A183JRM1_9TREM
LLKIKINIFHIGHTPSDNGKQELTSRITTSLLEKPESEQQQPSKTRNAASPSTSPIRNLLHRPSSIFGREGNSARSSISDPNKKPGLFNKVENFFKTNSPKYESVAVGNSTDEAVTTENNENIDQQQTHPTVLPKISVSYQSGDFQDNKNHNIKNEIMNETADKNNVTERSVNITESTNSDPVSNPIDVTSKPQNSSNVTQNNEMLKAKSDSTDKISNPISLSSNSKITVAKPPELKSEVPINNNTTNTHNESNTISNVVKPDTQPSKKESDSKTS